MGGSTAKVNPMILKKLAELKGPEKGLLMEVLVEELDHSDEKKWRYSDVYDAAFRGNVSIDATSSGIEEEKDED